MNQILAVTMTIGFVLTLAGAGTYAFFSDTETSVGNTFTAENHELKIKDADEDWRDGVTGTWMMSNMVPGDSVSSCVGLKRSGGGSNLNIFCNYAIDEGVWVEPETNHDNSADEMAEQMMITQMLYYGMGNLDLLTTDNYDTDYDPNPLDPGPMLEDIDGDGRITLYDLTAGVDVKPPNPAHDTRLDMTVQFDENAGNDFQGDTLTVNMIFILNDKI